MLERKISIEKINKHRDIQLWLINKDTESLVFLFVPQDGTKRLKSSVFFLIRLNIMLCVLLSKKNEKAEKETNRD